MRTIYGPNLFPTLSPNVEMAEEIAFTLVTNKKSKEMAKAFSIPSTNSRSKVLLILRASLLSKTTTTSIASKLAVSYSVLATSVAIASKPA